MLTLYPETSFLLKSQPLHASFSRSLGFLLEKKNKTQFIGAICKLSFNYAGFLLVLI